jgi:AraC-like DNA-binding protein
LRCLPPSAAELWWGVEPPGRHVAVLDGARGALLRVEDGRAALRGPGSGGWLGPGDACLVPPGAPLVLEVDPRGPLRHRLLLWLEARAEDRPILVVDGGAFEPALGRLERAAPQALERLVGRVRRRWRDADPAERTPSAPVRKAARLIEANLGRTLSAEQLARAAGLGKYHLAHRFKAEMGLSPHAHRVCARVAGAARRLRRGELLAGVAVQCGFADQSHLHRWFARVLGLTPGRYARAWRAARALGEAHPGSSRRIPTTR